MKFQKLIAVALLFALASLIACAPAPTPTPQPTVVPINTTIPATPTSSTITVTDSANRSVTIAGAPKRIVSLAPSTTEIAFALGLGERVVAVDTFSDYPADAKKIATIKTFPLNLEQIVSLKPDLVLAAGITSLDDVKKISDLKLTVLVVGAPATTFDSVFADITLVGKATGADAKAKTVVDAMKQKLDALKAKAATAKIKPRVFWELDATDPAKPYAPGPGSFLNDLIALAGSVNVTATAKTPYAQVNAEEVIAANPDVIILSDFAYGTTVESVKARKGWNVINAVKNDKVLPIDDNLVSRPGPRLVDGLEAALKLIHPELFQ